MADTSVRSGSASPGSRPKLTLSKLAVPRTHHWTGRQAVSLPVVDCITAVGMACVLEAGKEQEAPSSGESHPCHQMYVSGRTFPGAGVPEHVGGQGSGAGGLRSSGHSVHEKRGTES